MEFFKLPNQSYLYTFQLEHRTGFQWSFFQILSLHLSKAARIVPTTLRLWLMALFPHELQTWDWAREDSKYWYICSCMLQGLCVTARKGFYPFIRHTGGIKFFPLNQKEAKRKSANTPPKCQTGSKKEKSNPLMHLGLVPKGKPYRINANRQSYSHQCNKKLLPPVITRTRFRFAHTSALKRFSSSSSFGTCASHRVTKFAGTGRLPSCKCSTLWLKLNEAPSWSQLKGFDGGGVGGEGDTYDAWRLPNGNPLRLSVIEFLLRLTLSHSFLRPWWCWRWDCHSRRSTCLPLLSTTML